MKRKQLARIDLSNPDKPTIRFNNGNKAFLEDLRAFKDQSKCWILIESYSPLRSLEQNSFFHVICKEISDDTGQDFDKVKSTLKMLYARKQMEDDNGEPLWNKETGEPLEYIQDTSDMNKMEMADLITKSIMFAQEYFGIVIENINEQGALKFTDYPTIQL
jgi:hypothetical protein